MIRREVREFEGIVVDTRDWPIVAWESPPGPVSDAASAEALAHIEDLWRLTPLGSKCFMVFDLSRVTVAPSASQRRLATEFMARNEVLQAAASVGGAIVATSAIMRGVLTAVFWFGAPRLPTRIVSSRTIGLQYGLGLLEEQCPPLPEHLRHLRQRMERGAPG